MATGPELLVHPAAAQEFLAAVDWYAERHPDIARRFRLEVERAMLEIVEHPERWPWLDDSHRKLLLRRFPYVIVYRQFGERLWVVAVAHAHRRPGYWRGRDER